MAKEFFTDWETWEKLVFILALAIVVTVLLGCIKLVIVHRRLRKHAAIAESEKDHQLEQRAMEQKLKADSPTEAEVPFGVRALESGIEVEGVWHSRSNTPESSRPSSLLEPRKDPAFDLEAQRAINLAKRDSTSSSTKSLYIRCASDGDLTSLSGTKAPAPAIALAQPHRGYHPPSSLHRYGGKAYVACASSVASTIEGLDAIHKASTELNGDSSGSSERSANEIEPIAASAPKLFNIQTSNLKTTPTSNDFELLDSHRLSLAAETGQLTPRLRRLDSNGSSLPPSATSGPREHLDYFALPSSTIPTDSPSTTAFSQVASLPESVRQGSIPQGITPFAQFCQTTPPSPTSEKIPSRPASPLSPELTSPINTPSPLANLPPAISSGPLDPAPMIGPPKQPKRVSFETHHRPKVVRGQGSGFEILEQGSFPTEQNDDVKAGPPVSFYNGMTNVSTRRTRSRSRSSTRAGASPGRDGGGYERRKLQKRKGGARRASGGESSGEGSEVEEGLKWEVLV